MGQDVTLIGPMRRSPSVAPQPTISHITSTRQFLLLSVALTFFTNPLFSHAQERRWPFLCDSGLFTLWIANHSSLSREFPVTRR